MKELLKHLKGDRVIWAVVATLAIFSFMPIYSASTNLVYVVGNGTTTGHLLKHAFLLFFGFGIIYFVHKIPYRYFSGGSILMLYIVIPLLVYTLLQGTTIGGANASRWVRIPIVNFTFQPSTLASVVLMIYVARYLAQRKNEDIDFKESIWKLWVPVAVVLALILPANFSTTAILFVMVLLVCFIGGYPWKYLLGILGSGIVVLMVFVLTFKAFPEIAPNRVDTWIKRVENFFSGETESNYQVEKAKEAIVSGGVTGRGFGKSVLKNFMPQSTSDFIFPIIVEEAGLIGAFVIVTLYFLLLVRIIIVAQKASTIFATLVVVGVGLPIVFQAMVNMGVAVNLVPVTGQTLPLISSGGTSIWMTCIALGIVLSVSAARDEETSEDFEEIEEKDNKNLYDNPLQILNEKIG
ncbi:FtsW/RodA/SpoVE family cell cycle protein [Aureivirga sp. CE67]|uniref:FtsW/RodA/SpoVE family cell cycle protein n=1 Tax=Aureivirga sp. CE67 TaxID=1788983 RepID=UPI0018C9EBAA|nr:FtsW/RodA/SpoVE family cell cycle protein [Aureivirga sp. CE67]